MSAAPQHGHVHEVPAGASDAGCVVLDIGPGAGAAVVEAPVSLCGEEIEIRRAGQAWTGAHMAVRPRRAHGVEDTRYAAIFGGLAQGSYEFRIRGARSDTSVLALHVDEACVALARWPAPDAGGPSSA